MSALMLTSLTVARPSVRSRFSSARSGKPARAAAKHVPACASLKTETVQVRRRMAAARRSRARPCVVSPSELYSLASQATVASALFATLATCESAQAAQELVQLADNRPLVLLGLGLPVLGAISPYLAQSSSRLTPPRPTAGWVAFNIAQPALRQLDSMTGAEAPKKGPTKRR